MLRVETLTTGTVEEGKIWKFSVTDKRDVYLHALAVQSAQLNSCCFNEEVKKK